MHSLIPDCILDNAIHRKAAEEWWPFRWGEGNWSYVTKQDLYEENWIEGKTTEE